MATGLRSVVVAGCLGSALLYVGVGGLTRGADEPAAATTATPGREIPPQFAPFEYLVGSWKGAGVPSANKVKGWDETHAWAWKFEKGVPVGMSVEATNDKVLAKAQLLYDADAKTYTLKGTDPAGKPLTFTGALDKAGKVLTLDRVGTTAEGAKQRLTLSPNANFVRYTARFNEREAGSPQYKPFIEVGLTKEGESFAAGGSASDLPKCIVTGGAAAMSISYQGKSYPLCCSGCKDEFNDNPEKYIKKMSMRAESGAKGGAKPAAAGKDDGTFEGVMAEEPAKKKGPAPKSSASASAKAKAKAKAAEPADDATTATEPAAKSSAADAAVKAASLLKLGQNLEKSGKPASALGYYRQVVKLYPDSPSAKTASQRIKALGVR